MIYLFLWFKSQWLTKKGVIQLAAWKDMHGKDGNYSNRTYMIVPAATSIQDPPKRSKNEASKKNFTNH